MVATEVALQRLIKHEGSSQVSQRHVLDYRGLKLCQLDVEDFWSISI
jgi:hypothetical protein